MHRNFSILFLVFPVGAGLFVCFAAAVETEVRRLIRKEVVQGLALEPAEEEWLERTWARPEYEALCDRIDDEMEQEKEALATVPPPPPQGMPAPAASAGGAPASST